MTVPTSHPQPFLHRLNPLAKIIATLPAIVVLVALRDIGRPLALLILALALLLVGAHLDRRTSTLVLLGLPLLTAALSLSFGLWAAPEPDSTAALFTVGGYQFTVGKWLVGLSIALRLTAIIALGLVAGLTMTGPDFARALVRQGRLPYRIAYTALAAFRFLPRVRSDLAQIRDAHRIRGNGGPRGPLAGAHRLLSDIVPLLAGTIRHAERVAMVMDTRAFGAYPDRTERHTVRFRLSDGAFAAAGWLATALIAMWPWLI